MAQESASCLPIEKFMVGAYSKHQHAKIVAPVFFPVPWYMLNVLMVWHDCDCSCSFSPYFYYLFISIQFLPYILVHVLCPVFLFIFEFQALSFSPLPTGFCCYRLTHVVYQFMKQQYVYPRSPAVRDQIVKPTTVVAKLRPLCLVVQESFSAVNHCLDWHQLHSVPSLASPQLQQPSPGPTWQLTSDNSSSFLLLSNLAIKF